MATEKKLPPLCGRYWDKFDPRDSNKVPSGWDCRRFFCRISGAAREYPDRGTPPPCPYQDKFDAPAQATEDGKPCS